MSDVKVKFSGDSTQLKSDVQNISGIFSNWTKGAGSEILGLAGKFFAAGAAVEGIKKAFASLKEATEWAHNITLISERLDISTAAVQAYDLAAKRANVDSGAWAGSVEKVAKALVSAQTSGKTFDALSRLGVSIKTINEQDPQQAFEEIGRGLDSIPPSAQRTADLLEILGKKGGSLINMLKGIDSAVKDSKSFGHFVSDKDVETLNQYHKIMEGLGQGTKTATANFAAMAVSLVELVLPLRKVAEGYGLLDSHYKGQKEQEAAIKKLEANLEARSPKVNAEEQEKDDKAKAKEQLEAAKKLTEEKGKLVDETARLKEQNRLNSLSDEERLDALKEQLRLTETQIATDKKNGRDTQSIENLEALKLQAELTGEIYKLNEKVFNKKVQALKIAKPEAATANEQIGNFAGSNFKDKLGSLGETTNKLLTTIEKNTRPANQAAPNIFAP